MIIYFTTLKQALQSHFLNSAKTNWLRFTSLLAADIVNNNLRDLTNQERKMPPSLMTLFSIAQAVRKQNYSTEYQQFPCHDQCDQHFLHCAAPPYFHLILIRIFSPTAFHSESSATSYTLPSSA